MFNLQATKERNTAGFKRVIILIANAPMAVLVMDIVSMGDALVFPGNKESIVQKVCPSNPFILPRPLFAFYIHNVESAFS